MEMEFWLLSQQTPGREAAWAPDGDAVISPSTITTATIDSKLCCGSVHVLLTSLFTHQHLARSQNAIARSLALLLLLLLPPLPALLFPLFIITLTVLGLGALLPCSPSRLAIHLFSSPGHSVLSPQLSPLLSCAQCFWPALSLARRRSCSATLAGSVDSSFLTDSPSARACRGPPLFCNSAHLRSGLHLLPRSHSNAFSRLSVGHRA